MPAVAQRWLAHAGEHGASQLRTLEVLQVGGARLADELARQIRPVLGATLQQVFGMAEGLLNYTRLDDPDEVICGTQGRPLSPGDEVRIVDAAGNDLPDGVPGALLTRGPYTPRGYYRAPEQNAWHGQSRGGQVQMAGAARGRGRVAGHEGGQAGQEGAARPARPHPGRSLT